MHWIYNIRQQIIPMSFTDKQHVLWNMIDPGDPYDIKKSLIAKLPGDKKLYMGDHLELVVLFQSAEIERLIENLSQYQIKYKEVKKIQLDKHSFEVQIKELTELCEALEPLKSENVRLKEFVSRQTVEIEMLKRQLDGVDQDLNLKYNQALEKIDDLFNQKNSLRGELNVTKNKMIAAERSRHREVEDLKYDLNEKKISQENEINDLKRKFNSDIVQLEGDIRRYKEKLENERVTIDELRYSEQRLTEEVEQYRVKITSSNSDNVIRELQRKVEVVGSEKDRLQGLFNEKSREIGQYRSQIEEKEMRLERHNETIRGLEGKISRQEEEIRKLKRTDMSQNGESPSRHRDEVADLRRKIDEYQEQVALVSAQATRLQSVIDMRNLKIKEWERKYSNVQQNYESLKYQFEQNSSYNPSPTKSDFPTDTKTQDEVGDLQRKNGLLTREVQKLKRREETIREELESQIYQLNEEISQLRFQGSIAPRPKPGGETTNPLDPRPVITVPIPIPVINEQGAGNEGQIQSLNTEVYELKRVIEQRERQIRDYKQRITELRESVNTPTIPTGGYLNDSTTTPIKTQEIRRKLSQLQNKNTSLNRQVQRLNNTILTKQDDNNRLNLEISKLKKAMLDIPQPMNPSLVTNSRIDDRLRQENQELRSKVLPFVNEVSRLNEVLRVKLEELVFFRNENIGIKNEFQNYEREMVANKRMVEESKRKIAELQRSLESDPRVERLGNENRRLEQELQVALSRLGTPTNQPQPQTTSLKQEISRLTQIIARKQDDQNRLEGQYRQLQQTINNFKNDTGNSVHRINYEFQTKYNQLQSQLNQQITKGSNIQRNLSAQISQKEQEIINLRRVIAEKDQVINRTNLNFNQQIHGFESNVANQISEANRKITALIQENDQLKGKDGQVAHELNERKHAITILTQELERANTALAQHIEQIKNYERTYQQLVPYKEQLEAKIREQHLLIQNSQEKIPQLAGQIQRLNSTLSQKVQECQDLKRNINQFNSKYMDILAQHQRVVNAANSHNQKREQEIEQGIREYEQIIIQLKRQLEETQRNTEGFVQQTREYEGRINSITAERDRLNNALNGKNGDIQNLTNELNQTKWALQNNGSEIERQRAEFERQVNNLSSELERLTQTFNIKSEEERRGFMAEIERLNNTLRLKVEESQEWHNQNAILTRKLEEVSRAYNQLLPEYEASRGRTTEFQDKLNRLVEEFQRLSQIINRQKEENLGLKNELMRFGNLEEMNKKLSAEIDRLNQTKQELEQDIGELRIRYSDEAALQKRLNEQLSLFVVLFAEIESLRKRVKDKEREVEEVRRSSLAPFRV